MKTLKVLLSMHNRYIRRDPNIEEFISLNKQKLRSSDFKNGIALFEAGYFHPIFVVYHYLARVCNEEGLLKVAYTPDNSVPFKTRLIQRIISRLNIENGTFQPYRILKSFGISKFILAPKFAPSNLAYKELAKDLYSEDKFQVLRMCFRGIRVGDLFYDWHLRRTGKATLDFKDKNLHRDFRIFCSNLIFWLRYFDKNEVKYVFVSHAVYVQGIMARIGLSRGSKVFVVGDDRFNQLSLDNYYQDSEHKYYSPLAQKQFNYKIDLSRASNALAMLQTGSLEVDSAHRIVSGFRGESITKIVSSAANVRVLIAAHCFSDAPHVFGDLHAVDFWEWLEVISEFALKKPEYEWYIKAHPGFFKSDEELFLKYTRTNPHLKIVSSSYSNLELFRQGINVVLTGYGTITLEAALFNKLVINCSPNSPHMNYSFAKKPTSLNNFIEILNQLEDLVAQNTVERSELLHFYDLHHLRKGHSWLYKQYHSEMLEYAGGYGEHLTNSRTLKYWILNYTSQSRSESIMNILKNFIESNDYLIPFISEYTD